MVSRYGTRLDFYIRFWPIHRIVDISNQYQHARDINMLIELSRITGAFYVAFCDDSYVLQYAASLLSTAWYS